MNTKKLLVFLDYLFQVIVLSVILYSLYYFFKLYKFGDNNESFYLKNDT